MKEKGRNTSKKNSRNSKKIQNGGNAKENRGVFQTSIPSTTDTTGRASGGLT